VHTVHGIPEDIAPGVGRVVAKSTRPGISRRRRWWLESVYLRVEAALATLGLVVTPSLAMKRYLVDRGMPSHRVAVVPSCVPIRRRASPTLRTPTTIGTVANLEWWKGIDTLMHALARVERPVRLEIFGDGAERGSLEGLADSCGVDATFHGHVADAVDFLGTLDVFVLPSRAENFPIALLEAMSWALPSVATRVGGVAEMIEPGTSGLLVPPDDATALANAIEDLIDRPAWARGIGAAAAARVAGHYDPAEGGRSMVEVYRALCASSS
jgi:glycosyltransferase involved in cell wall biosynthesis